MHRLVVVGENLTLRDCQPCQGKWHSQQSVHGLWFVLVDGDTGSSYLLCLHNCCLHLHNNLLWCLRLHK